VDEFLQRTKQGNVAYDLLPLGSGLRALYEWDGLPRLLEVLLAGTLPGSEQTGRRRVHRLADPLGACSVLVYRESFEIGWHFDEALFSVSLCLQAPEAGGRFEYLPHSRGDEVRVRRSLTGSGEARTLEADPGDLVIFLGSQMLHRVTPVSGARDRLVACFCFADAPGVHNSPAVQTSFFGRAAAHPPPLYDH